MVAKKTETKFKLDIQEVLSALDNRDRDYYKNLPEEGKKALALQEVILRWMSSVGSSTVDWAEARRQGRTKGDKKGAWPSTVSDSKFTEYYLMVVNDTANIGFGYHELYKHPELEWLLLTLAGAGQKQEHVWIPSSPKSETPNIDAMFRKKYPLASNKEIKMVIKLSTDNEIINMVSDYGNPDKLSASEAKVMKEERAGVFDLHTIKAELKKIGR